MTGDSRPLVDPTHTIQVFLEHLEHQDLDLIGFVVVRPLIPSLSAFEHLEKWALFLVVLGYTTEASENP